MTESGQFGVSVALSGEGDTPPLGAVEDNRFAGAAWVVLVVL